MKIVVGGSRKFNDYKSFSKWMDSLISEVATNKSITIISGHCSGTDMLGEKYAAEHGYEVEIFEAEWERYGRAAGPVRNKLMVENADMVIAFWDGNSRGTKSLIGYAEKLGRVVRIIRIG